MADDLLNAPAPISSPAPADPTTNDSAIPPPMDAATPASDGDLSATVQQAAQENGIPPGILHAQAREESHLNPQARSQKGAQGVMQLMPRTAAGLGVDPTDTNANIHGGAKYLKQLHAQFGSWDKALAAYNWGPGHLHQALTEHGDDWLAAAPKETQNYVHNILTHPVIGPVQTAPPATGATPTVQSAPHTLSERVGDFFHMPSDEYDKKYAADNAERNKKIDSVLGHLIPFHTEMNQAQKALEGTKAGKQVSDLVQDQLRHPEQLAMGGMEGPEGEISGALEGLGKSAAPKSPLSGKLSEIPGAITVKPAAQPSPLDAIPGAIKVKAGLEPPAPKLPAQRVVEAAGGVFRGINKDGLVEITLPRSMTDKLALEDRMKPFVSVTMPEADLTPENIKAAMDAKFKQFGGKLNEPEPAAEPAPPAPPAPATEKPAHVYHAVSPDEIPQIAEAGLPKGLSMRAPDTTRTRLLRMKPDTDVHNVDGAGRISTIQSVPSEKLELRNPDGTWRPLSKRKKK